MNEFFKELVNYANQFSYDSECDLCSLLLSNLFHNLFILLWIVGSLYLIIVSTTGDANFAKFISITKIRKC